MKIRLLALSAFLVLSFARPGVAANETNAAPLNLGTRLEMFVDRFLIANMPGTGLTLPPPQPAGVVFPFNEDWDGACSSYATILSDQGVYRMYYVGLPMHDKDESAHSYVCYAE